MQTLFVLIICIIAIPTVVIVVVRICLKNKSKELSKRIATITSYKDIRESKEKDVRHNNESFFIGIGTDLRNSFSGL